MKYKYFLLCIVIISVVLTSHSIALAEGRTENTVLANYNIVFVIDVSGSMASEDPDGIKRELTKMIVDTAPPTRTQIGFTVFNHSIVDSRPLTPINNQENRANIKTAIDHIEIGGNTDIGIAIDYALNMFPSTPLGETTNHNAIIFLSDGEQTNFAQYGRSMEDAMAFEQAAFDRAAQLGIAIYAICIMAVGDYDPAYMHALADSTNGKAFEITDIAQLPGLFNQLYADVFGIVPMKYSVVGTGAPQSVELPIPHMHAAQSNILVWHNEGARNGQDVFIDGNSFQYNSRRFGSTKITQIPTNSVEISLTANQGEEINFFVINHLDIFPAITMPRNLSALNVPIEARLHRLNRDAPLTDGRFYAGLTAQLEVENLSTGQSIVIPMENTGTSFSAMYENTSPGPVEFRVRVTGDGYEADSLVLPVTFSNTPPSRTSEVVPDTMRIRNRTITFDLDDFFEHSDGDSLTYEISGEIPDMATLQYNTLTLDLAARGSESFLLYASDSRGGTASYTVAFEVVSFWVYYRSSILIIALIFFTLLTLYIVFLLRMRLVEKAPAHIPIFADGIKFTDARFEGYFINTLSGNEIPILNWNASYIENKHKISLGEMFHMLDVHEKLPEAHKIYFTAGYNHTVVFHHSTDCTVSLADKEVPRGKKETLNYDNKLFIVFEDHSTEVEIRYKRVKSRQRFVSDELVAKQL